MFVQGWGRKFVTALDVGVSDDATITTALTVGTVTTEVHRWQRRYLRVAVLADGLVALIAGCVAFLARFGDVTASNRQYLIASLLLPAGWIIAVALSRAYETRFLFVGPEEYQRVVFAGVSTIAAVAIVSYAAHLQIARGYVVVALPGLMVGDIAVRHVMRKWLHRRRNSSDRYMRKVLLVGYEQPVARMAQQLHRERYHGMRVVGACVPRRNLARGDLALEIFGTFDDVAEAVQTARADTVAVLACPEFDAEALRHLAWELEIDDVDLIVAPALIDVAGPRTTIRPVDGLPLLHVEHPMLSGGRRLVKELFDRGLAGLGLLLLAPLLLGIALAVRVTSRGPVLFCQQRVGKGGVTFRMYKFRSMAADAEQRRDTLPEQPTSGVLFKIRNDPRMTPLGRWLRRYSLDELPQLLNVMRGQMSLVGPRPPLPAEVEQYLDDARRRLVVKPGLTGLWQVSGRSDLSWTESIRLDLRYVENWSMTLDLLILWRTISAVFRGAGAY
jgi:exopolysaccharide biosynthesis polyprenyl glycosylphosphotransferase